MGQKHFISNFREGAYATPVLKQGGGHMHTVPHGCARLWSMVLFYAFMLMLLTKFIPNRTIRRCSSGTNFFNYDTKSASKIIQMHFLHPIRRFVQIRYHKNTVTKMHKYLDGLPTLPLPQLGKPFMLRYF